MYLKYLSWRQCTAQQLSEETAQRWVRVTLQAWAVGEGHPRTIFVGELDGSKIMPQVFKTIFTTCLWPLLRWGLISRLFALGRCWLSSFWVRRTPLLLQTAVLSSSLLGRQNFYLIFDRNFSSIFFILICEKGSYTITQTPLHLPHKMSVGSGCDGFMLWFCPHRLVMLNLSCFHAFMLALLLSFCLLMLWEISCRAFQLATVRSARYFLISLRTKQVLRSWTTIQRLIWLSSELRAHALTGIVCLRRGSHRGRIFPPRGAS